MESDVFLDESFGFNLDGELELSSKSTRDDDGLNSNPHRILKALFRYRQDIKDEIERTNAKMSAIDTRITEILASISSDEFNVKNSSNLNSRTDKITPRTLLSVHHAPKLDDLNESKYTFGLNTNLNLSQMTRSISSNMAKKNMLGSIFNQPHIEYETVFDTKKDPPPPKSNDKAAKPPGARLKKSMSHLGPKKSDLAASNASTVDAEVVGVTALLSKKSPFSFGGLDSSSNYNVNLIVTDAPEKRKHLTSSASENLIKSIKLSSHQHVIN